MKPYPSIPSSMGQSFTEIPNAYVFDKLDGRNVRVEWTKKAGWHKWGSRHQLFDPVRPEDPSYQPALALFKRDFEEKLTRICVDNRWPAVTAYFELWQQDSLAGVFTPTSECHLTLFDVDVFKQCMLGPKDFLKHFNGVVPTPMFLGRVNWTRDFVQRVRESATGCVITFEGVVGKAGEQHHQVRAKAKTQKWIDAVLARYGAEQGQKIIES